MSLSKLLFFVAVSGVAVMLSLGKRDNAVQNEPSRIAVHSGKRILASRSTSSEAAVLRDIDDLRWQVRAMAKERGESPESPTGEETLIDVASPADDDDVSASHESPEEIAERLSESFAADDIDSSATSQAASHIADHLTGKGIGRLADVGCGRTQCLAQVDFKDAAARDAGLQGIGSMLPWDTDGFFISDPDDERRVSVHFSREGYPLPARGSR